MKRFLVIRAYRAAVSYDDLETAENMADIIGRAWVIDRVSSQVVAGYVPHLFGGCHEVPAAYFANLAGKYSNPRRVRNFERSRIKHACKVSRLLVGAVYPAAVIH